MWLWATPGRMKKMFPKPSCSATWGIQHPRDTALTQYEKKGLYEETFSLSLPYIVALIAGLTAVNKKDSTVWIL
jgi:hypothetical protein